MKYIGNIFKRKYFITHTKCYHKNWQCSYEKPIHRMTFSEFENDVREINSNITNNDFCILNMPKGPQTLEKSDIKKLLENKQDLKKFYDNNSV